MSKPRGITTALGLLEDTNLYLNDIEKDMYGKPNELYSKSPNRLTTTEILVMCAIWPVAVMMIVVKGQHNFSIAKIMGSEDGAWPIALVMSAMLKVLTEVIVENNHTYPRSIRYSNSYNSTKIKTTTLTDMLTALRYEVDEERSKAIKNELAIIFFQIKHSITSRYEDIKANDEYANRLESLNFLIRYKSILNDVEREINSEIKEKLDNYEKNFSSIVSIQHRKSVPHIGYIFKFFLLFLVVGIVAASKTDSSDIKQEKLEVQIGAFSLIKKSVFACTALIAFGRRHISISKIYERSCMFKKSHYYPVVFISVVTLIWRALALTISVSPLKSDICGMNNRIPTIVSTIILFVTVCYDFWFYYIKICRPIHIMLTRRILPGETYIRERGNIKLISWLNMVRMVESELIISVMLLGISVNAGVCGGLSFWNWSIAVFKVILSLANIVVRMKRHPIEMLNADASHEEIETWKKNMFIDGQNSYIAPNFSFVSDNV